MQIEDLSVEISINKGCSTTYSPGEKMLISCSASADCVAELKLTYPNRNSRILVSNQVLRQGKDLILEERVPENPGTYTLTLYGRTPFGVKQDICSYTCESTGSLLVGSTVQGALVYVDNVYCGSSPAYTKNVPVGMHEISVVGPGYGEWKSEVIVEKGLKTTVHAVLTEVRKKHEEHPETGSVYIRSEPSGGEVYLDGISKGITPVLLENIPAGTHTVRVTKKEFHDFDQVITITPGGPIFVSANLGRGHGSVQVFTSVSGTKAYLDDEFQGIAPLTIYNVSEGEHSLSLVKWGYEIWSSSIQVKAHEPVNVYPNVSLLWIWYVLAAIGIPFYKLRKLIQNVRKSRELPPYIPEVSYSRVSVTSKTMSEPEPVLLCRFCSQELHTYKDEILECSFCEKEGLSCHFHRSCWMKWLEQTEGKRKCILYPAIVRIPAHKIHTVKLKPS